jgi:saccharopine dehydrogenase-like NADP-dependent oxidoreductase
VARVLVVGGYGVFGSKLCDLLVRDGHDVIVAGRNAGKAKALATQLGCTAARIDTSGDLTPITQLAPDVLVDAAGPFHSYGDDPYRLVQFCLESAVHYLDLSDDAPFSTGITALDDLAIAKGCFAISGASSVPGLSSAVVNALSNDMDRIDVIESAILPGNRAPRGYSVIASILNQMGRPMRLWRGGAWREAPTWSSRRTYDLDAGTRRAARMISVPDLTLFPAAFGARSVLFRAGLELPVMNAGLRLFGALRRVGLVSANPFWVRAMQWMADRLEPLGTDRGGMIVDVTGTVRGDPIRRRWRLLVEEGDGPFIPTIAVRTLLRDFTRIAPGARACVAAFPLDQAEDAMQDLKVTTHRNEEIVQPLFQRALGPVWTDLDPVHQQSHWVFDFERLTGRASVERGKSWMARLLAAIFRFPKAGADVPVCVTKTTTTEGETWEREFAGRLFRSHLSIGTKTGHVFERFGPFRFELSLPVADGRMALEVTRGWVFGLPLPAILLPVSDSSEYVENGQFHFDVGMIAPLGGGLIVRYRGWLESDAPI